MWKLARGGPQPLRRTLPSAIHLDRRELIDESQQRGFQRRLPQAQLKPGEGVGEASRIALLPVEGEDEMHDLVDQPHGIYSAGIHGLLRMPDGISHQIHAFRKPPAGGQIGKDHIAGKREQLLGEAVEVSRGAGDVELELWSSANHVRIILRELCLSRASLPSPAAEFYPFGK